jgi:tetratricopeptide (TPR) repeat protein
MHPNKALLLVLISLIMYNAYSMDLSAANKNIKELNSKIDQLKLPDLYKLARSYEYIGSYESALKIYRSIMSQNEKHYESRTRAAFCLFKLKKEKESISLYKEAIEINKSREEAYLSLIQIYETKKNKYELRILYQDLIQNVGAKPKFISSVCELAQQEGLHELAKSFCEKGMKQDKESPKSFINYALMLKETGQTEEAKKILLSAIEKFKTFDEPKITLAQIYEDNKSTVEALKYYKLAHELNTRNPITLRGLSNSYFELQNFEEALKFFIQACEVDKAQITAFKKATNILKKSKNSTQLEWSKKYESALSLCRNN